MYGAYNHNYDSTEAIPAGKLQPHGSWSWIPRTDAETRDARRNLQVPACTNFQKFRLHPQPTLRSGAAALFSTTSPIVLLAANQNATHLSGLKSRTKFWKFNTCTPWVIVDDDCGPYTGEDPCAVIVAQFIIAFFTREMVAYICSSGIQKLWKSRKVSYQ